LEEYDEDWVLDQRERFQLLYLRLLAILMTLYTERKSIEDAIDPDADIVELQFDPDTVYDCTDL
jgi:two-component SAPR family response regulator